MVKDIINYNGKEYQLATVNINGCFETMIFPIENGVISGNEVYMCRVYNAGQSHDEHRDIYYHPERYLSDEAIANYLKSKEDDFKIDDSIFVVGGYINEHGDTDTWIEKLFDDEEQANACCEFLNRTKSQDNVSFNTYKVDGLCKEDYISKLKYLNI